MKKITKIIGFLIILLAGDFVASNLFFKKKEFWEYERLLDHYWRVSSDIYHHGLMKNIDVIEPWGFSIKKRKFKN